MVKERFLKRREFDKFLECYCRKVDAARKDTGALISKSPLKIEQRTLGTNCTCTIAKDNKRKRPFRVGHTVLVEGWK